MKRRRIHSASALERSGWEHTPAYDTAVQQLKSLLICTPSWQRLSNNRVTVPPDQLRRSDHPVEFEQLADHAGDKESFFRTALELPHPLNATSTFLTSEIDAAVRTMCDLGTDLPAWRAGRIERIEQIVRDLRPLSQEMAASRPQHIIASDRHPELAFMAAFIDAADWPDKDLIADLMKGMQIVGTMPDTGLYELKPETKRAAQSSSRVSISELAVGSPDHASHGANNGQIRSRLKAQFKAAVRNGDHDTVMHMRRAKEMSDEEVKEKMADGPLTFSQLNARFGFGPKTFEGRVSVGPDWRGMARSHIFQGTKTDGTPKERLIDDGKGNHINLAAVCLEVLAMKPADFVAAVARRIVQLLGRCEIGSGNEDEQDAYRSVPSDAPKFQVCLVYDETLDDVVGYVPRGLNYGLKLSPIQYCRRAEVLCGMAISLFAVPVSHFIDDFSTPEVLATRGPIDPQGVGGLRAPLSGQGILCTLADIVSATFSAKKSELSASLSTSCGTVTDCRGIIDAGLVLLSIKESTRVKVCAALESSLESGVLHPRTAGTIAGKGRYALVHSKAGRAALRSVYHRQHSAPSDLTVDICMRLDLELLHSVFSDPPHVILRMERSARRPVVIFSDASYARTVQPPNLFGDGVVAFIVAIPFGLDEHRFYYMSEEIPQSLLLQLFKLRPQLNFIYSLEALGIAAPYFCPLLTGLLAGRDCLHFGDNQASNGAMRNGYTSSRDVSQYVGNLHLRLARLQIRWWIEYVPTDANLSDLPSRRDAKSVSEWADFCARHNPTRVPLVLPSLTSWSG